VAPKLPAWPEDDPQAQTAQQAFYRQMSRALQTQLAGFQ
jgi:hypothetical protein